jgi:hypothetical protein
MMVVHVAVDGSREIHVFDGRRSHNSDNAEQRGSILDSAVPGSGQTNSNAANQETRETKKQKYVKNRS